MRRNFTYKEFCNNTKWIFEAGCFFSEEAKDDLRRTKPQQFVSRVMETFKSSEHLKKKSAQQSVGGVSQQQSGGGGGGGGSGTEFTVSHVFGECTYKVPHMLNSFRRMPQQLEQKVFLLLQTFELKYSSVY